MRQSRAVMSPSAFSDQWVPWPCAVDVDDDPRAVYFRQARFGMFGRMALLLTLSKLPFERAGHHEIGADPGIRCSNHKCITRTELYVPLHGKIGDRCPYCDKLLELDI